MKTAALKSLVDEVVRSSRKTIGIEVRSDGRAIIRAPMRAPVSEIEQAVWNRRDWIIQKKAEMLARKPEPKVYRDGELFYYLGELRTLRISSGARFAIEYSNGEFILAEDCLENARDYFEKWYTKQARLVFEKRAKELAGLHGFKYLKIKLSSAEGRWGSCSSKGYINLNKKLIMAPLAVLDYVILHELSHTVHMDHTKRF